MRKTILATAIALASTSAIAAPTTYVKVQVIGCPTEQNMLTLRHQVLLGVSGLLFLMTAAQMGCIWIDNGMVGNIAGKGDAEFVPFTLGQEGPATGTTWWVPRSILGYTATDVYTPQKPDNTPPTPKQRILLP